MPHERLVEARERVEQAGPGGGGDRVAGGLELVERGEASLAHGRVGVGCSCARSSRSTCRPVGSRRSGSRAAASACTGQASRCTSRSRMSGPERSVSEGPSSAIRPQASGPKKPIVSFFAQYRCQ